MRGDGDGWMTCAAGHTHWGKHGAAGLLVTTVGDGGVPLVLLQLRANWSHEGGTWSIPGGARDSHEASAATALREAAEEVGLDPDLVEVLETSRDDHGGWSYDTILARCDRPLATTDHAETAATRWVPVPEVEELPLHSGFAASWPALRERLTVKAPPVGGDHVDPHRAVLGQHLGGAPRGVEGTDDGTLLGGELLAGLAPPAEEPARGQEADGATEERAADGGDGSGG